MSGVGLALLRLSGYHCTMHFVFNVYAVLPQKVFRASQFRLAIEISFAIKQPSVLNVALCIRTCCSWSMPFSSHHTKLTQLSHWYSGTESTWAQGVLDPMNLIPAHWRSKNRCAFTGAWFCSPADIYSAYRAKYEAAGKCASSWFRENPIMRCLEIFGRDISQKMVNQIIGYLCLNSGSTKPKAIEICVVVASNEFSRVTQGRGKLYQQDMKEHTL